MSAAPSAARPRGGGAVEDAAAAGLAAPVADRTLRLTIATPGGLLADEPITALRAEDDSGGFGILPGHADFLTVLVPSVLRWRTGAGAERYCAVEEGVLRVAGGHAVTIACRDGVLGESLDVLDARIRAARERRRDEARRARTEQTRLQASAVRHLVRALRPGAPSPLEEPGGLADAARAQEREP